MNTDALTNYFLQPREVAQRRYEALRSVFVDGLSLKEVAQRFEVSYGTVRNWVSEFRRAPNADQPPPLLSPRRADVPREENAMTTTSPKPKSPMWRRCR